MLRHLCGLSVGLCVLALSASSWAETSDASRNDAWEARIVQLLEVVEQDVRQIDGHEAPAGADLGSRLRGLDRRVGHIERTLEMPVRRAVLYEGSLVERRLSSYTNVAAQLKSRVRKASAERKRQAMAAHLPARDDASSGDGDALRGRTSARTRARDLLGETERKPQIVQAYDSRTNRTSQKLIHVPFAADLRGDITIQFQHEPNTVDVKDDDPADWSLERLLEETELLPRVGLTLINESLTVRYGPCEPMTLSAGVGEERITVKGYALRKRGLSALTAARRKMRQIMQATWCPATPVLCVRELANAPQEGVAMRASLDGSGRAIDGTLSKTDIRIEGEVYDLFDGLMRAFDLDRERRGSEATPE